MFLVPKYFHQRVTRAREYTGGRSVLWTRREFSIRIMKGLTVWMLIFNTKLVMRSGWVLNNGGGGGDPNI